MSLLGCEGFDCYGIDELSDFFLSAGSPSSIVQGEGRCDSAAYFSSSSGSGPAVGVNPATPYEGYVAWAQRIVDFGGTVPRVIIDSNGALAGVITGPTVRLNYDGSISIVRSNSGATVVATSAANLVHLDVWNHYGLEFKVDPSAGYIRLYFNGVLLLSYTGDTSPPSFGMSYFPGWTKISWAPTGYLDDLYWGDAAGPAPFNTYLGNLRVEGQLPVRDGLANTFYRSFTPVGGTDHGNMVNENPPDEDTTYLESGAIGAREMFVFPDVTTEAGNYLAIQLQARVRTEGLGALSIAPTIESAASYVEGTAVPVGSTYSYITQMFSLNPVTGGLWTEGEVNASEGGVTIR